MLIRAEKPSALSRDAPLSGSTEDSKTTMAARGNVVAVVDGAHFGAFALRNEQTAALNVFVPLAYLQDKIEKLGRANVLLVDGIGDVARAGEVLGEVWELADAGLELREIERSGEVELNTSRVFLDDEVVAVTAAMTGGRAQNVLTYLVTGIKSASGVTPYSMVAAVDGRRKSLFPRRMGGNDLVITEWLAKDRGVGVGDGLDLTYNVTGSGRKLEERVETFRVARVLPMDSPEVAADWTPDFPGISENDNCRDWDPGFAMDEDAIRDVDEDYWDEYKGTPKAFLTLAEGQFLWSNRFGSTTAVRFPEGAEVEQVAVELRSALTLEEVALQLVDVAGQASAAVAGSMDFGGLFASMSFFLVLAALVLAALLFLFGIEKRSGQIGLLMAVGLTGKQVRSVFVREALVLAVVGAGVGVLLGSVYTKAALWGLSGGWSGAVAGARMEFSASGASVGYSFVATVLMAWGIVFLAARKLAKAEPHVLLAGGVPGGVSRAGKAVGRKRRVVGVVVSVGGAAALLWASRGASAVVAPGLFFGAGFLLLAAALCGLSLWLGRGRAEAGSVWALGVRNAARRPGRSVAVAGLMAGGVFLVVAVNAFRLSAEQDAGLRSSGTGGFALYGRTTMPVFEDLNGAVGRQVFGLDDEEMAGVSVVAMRQSDGDDASCLNLNRAQAPMVLGVDAGALVERGAFTFAALAEGADGWGVLDSNPGQGVVPGVVDQNTAMWALKMGIGDDLHYRDQRGGVVKVRIVGMLAGSMLQGRVIISAGHFEELFPGSDGYRAFLIDVEGDGERAGEVAGALSKRMRNRGIEVMGAAQRLDEFNVVQNTYLSIFTVLGGLGVLLGTVGLAVVVARNVVERRGELGVMRAVGFSKGQLAKLVVGEHWFLHVSGVVSGAVAAMLAVWPTLSAPGAGLPVGLMSGLVAGVLVAGVCFCWLAAVLALRAPLMDSIRSE